jgi:hypothetical protein
MIGQNPITLILNNAPQPTQMDFVLQSTNGSQIVTGGITV